MTTWDRQDKPLAREFKKFSQVVGQLDLTGISPAPADVGDCRFRMSGRSLTATFRILA